jgi:membrane-associated protease RseP (regulator of RpoE activity)
MTPADTPVQLKLWRKGKIIKRSAYTKTTPALTFASQPLWSQRHFVCLEGIIVQEVSEELIEGLHQTYNIDPCFLFREHFESKSKLLITHICPESPAEDLFIEIGDFVDKLNGQKMNSLKTLEAALNSLVSKKKTKASILIETSSGLMASLTLNWNKDQPKPWSIRLPQEPSSK